MALIRRELLLSDAPTLFLLHGWGSDANDLYSMAAPMHLTQSIVALQGPDVHPSGAGFSWFDIGWTDRGVSLDVDQARERAKTLSATFAEYPRPWTVLGFSQGAMMAALLLAEQPEVLDATVMIAGMLLPTVKPVQGERRRVLITHGRADEVVPFVEGEQMAQEFGKSHDVTFLPDSGGHGVSMNQVIGIGGFLAAK